VGDTPDKIAQTYNANAREIIAFNDAEIKGIALGDTIVIPNGVKPRPVVAFKANYGYNGYWYGYCTWYVATKINVPNNWGNANRWDDNARQTPGWTVSSTPVVGAVSQSNSGPEGHVGIVEAVSEDGTMIKYSDMNGLAGWGRAGFSDWVPARSRFQNFIYRVQ
jgi:surface antigen